MSPIIPSLLVRAVHIGLNTLTDFRHKTKYVAQSGEEGGKKNCHGKNGEDLVIKVPAGTVIRGAEIHDLIRRLGKHLRLIRGYLPLQNRCVHLSPQHLKPIIFQKEFFPEYMEEISLPYTVEKLEEGLYSVEGPRIEKMLGYTNLEAEKGFEFFQNFMASFTACSNSSVRLAFPI